MATESLKFCHCCPDWGRALKRHLGDPPHKCAWKVYTSFSGEDESLCNCCEDCTKKCDAKYDELAEKAA